MPVGNNSSVEFNGEQYLQIRGAWYNARTYIKPPEIISRQLDERFGSVSSVKPQRTTTRGTRPRPGL